MNNDYEAANLSFLRERWWREREKGLRETEKRRTTDEGLRDR